MEMLTEGWPRSERASDEMTLLRCGFDQGRVMSVCVCALRGGSYPLAILSALSLVRRGACRALISHLVARARDSLRCLFSCRSGARLNLLEVPQRCVRARASRGVSSGERSDPGPGRDPTATRETGPV